MFIKVKRIEAEAGSENVRVIFVAAPTQEDLVMVRATSMSEFGMDFPTADAPELGAVTEADFA